MLFPAGKNNLLRAAILLLLAGAIYPDRLLAVPHLWYTDTAYVQSLCLKAREYETINTDSSLQLAAVAGEVSRRDHYYYGIGTALQRAGSAYCIKGYFDKALQLNKEAIVFYILSAIHDEGKPLTHWTQGIVGTLANSGTVYENKGDFDKAMQSYYQALQLVQLTDRDPVTLTNLYNNIGALYISMRMFDQGLLYLQKAVAASGNRERNPVLSITYSNMSVVWSFRQDTAQSLACARKAQTIAAVNNDPKLQYATDMMLGDLYQLKENDTAIQYYQRCVHYAAMLSVNESCAAIFKLGAAYDNFKDYTRGAINLKNALHTAESISGRVMRLNILEALYGHYQLLGQYKKAFAYQHAYLLLKDSLRDEKNTQTINQLDARNKSTLKDRELQRRQMLIVQQEASIDRKNRVITGVTAGIMILLLLLWLRHRIYIFRQREQTQKIKEMRQENEISVLKAVAGAEEQERKRIAQELHDGVSGTLSVVKMRISALTDKTPDAVETMQLLDSAINDVRNTAHNLSPEMILEDGLQEAVDFFCRMINQSGSVHIDVQHSGEIKRLSALLQLAVFRITQELIQNILKHAQAHNVLLQLGLWEDLFSLTIEDDGIGFNTSCHEKKQGLGLRNVGLRVQALHGDMSINSNPGNGTTVYIEFDINQQI